MSGNASKEVNKEVRQIAEFLGSLGKAAAIFAPKMTTQARQSWIGTPPEQFAHLLEELVFLPGDSTPSWREEDDVIYFSVTSDGMTGEDWIKRLEGKGFCIEDYVKPVLRSPNFKPTNGVTTEVVVLKGMLFKNNDRMTKEILVEAKKRKLGKPEPELACLIREKFTDKEIEKMGLWYIVAMHEPISDSDGTPSLLSVYTLHGGRQLALARNKHNDSPWDYRSGFAFALSQVSSKH